MAGRGNSRVFRTPLGWAGVAVSGNGVVRVVLPRKTRRATERELRATEELTSVSAAGPACLRDAVRLVRQALAGELLVNNLTLDLDRYTNFQRAVWKATATIPFGETRSYAWIARRIGRPKAARAVGQAMGANPVPILVP